MCTFTAKVNLNEAKKKCKLPVKPTKLQEFAFSQWNFNALKYSRTVCSPLPHTAQHNTAQHSTLTLIALDMRVRAFENFMLNERIKISQRRRHRSVYVSRVLTVFKINKFISYTPTQKVEDQFWLFDFSWHFRMKIVVGFFFLC